MLGILCVLPPSAVFLFWAGGKLKPRETGRTQRKTTVARSSLRTHLHHLGMTIKNFDGLLSDMS